jgi:hypothetical protein
MEPPSRRNELCNYAWISVTLLWQIYTSALKPLGERHQQKCGSLAESRLRSNILSHLVRSESSSIFNFLNILLLLHVLERDGRELIVAALVPAQFEPLWQIR